MGGSVNTSKTPGVCWAMEDPTRLTPGVSNRRITMRLDRPLGFAKMIGVRASDGRQCQYQQNPRGLLGNGGGLLGRRPVYYDHRIRTLFMNTQSTLFTQVRPFYQNLGAALEMAQQRISMMYFTFDHGEHAGRLAYFLAAKAAEGVEVRLMVDLYGLFVDAPRHALANRRLITRLREGGVQVDLFRPQGWRLSAANRLHCKVCAIDDQTVFIGGSNIGDHYLGWDDHNMRFDGDLGSVFHDLYDYIRHHTPEGQQQAAPQLHLSRLLAGQLRVVLTIPKQRNDIRRALLGLILDAEESIYIRNCQCR